jgi:hypothetical protein
VEFDVSYSLRARLVASVVVVVVALAAPGAAMARPLDISLRGLGRPDLDPACATDSLGCPTTLRLRGLSAELAMALAPRVLQPAETLGVAGFELSAATTLSSISNKADYWQGQPGAPIIEPGNTVPSMLVVPTVHLRKGLPLSTELGVEASYLAQSQLFMLGAELKVALHEQFIEYLPAVALRIAAARLFGSTELEMLTFEADGMISYAFGIGGMVQLTPYLGYGQLAVHVNTAVLDETPYVVLDPTDQTGGPTGSLYTFPTLQWTKNRYGRWFGGLRFDVAALELLYEFEYTQTSFGSRRVVGHTIKLGFDI